MRHAAPGRLCRIMIVAGLLGAGLAAAAANGSRLVFNGKVASTDVRTIDGSAYVKLADVAKALGMVVVKRPDGYEITKAGGANQVAGDVRGKVGDVLFDGKWRFQVLESNVAGTYTMKHKATTDLAVYNAVAEYDADTRVFTAKPGRTLVLLKCRATNGRKQPQALWLANSDTRTALADAEGGSHPPIAYDIEESAPFQSKALLPGAGTDFVVLFSVPENFRAKDLVFTLRTIDNADKGSDVRVSLTAGAGPQGSEGR
jgi:hypothetical protein